MIKKAFALMILVALLSVASLAQQPTPPKTNLKVGQVAPDFTLTDTEGKPVKLSDFKGKKNVVLAFYVLAFTGG
jgi:cytochrome oxidase Cu insertion factor (SCO1/SenC/PrrC family)